MNKTNLSRQELAILLAMSFLSLFVAKYIDPIVPLGLSRFFILGILIYGFIMTLRRNKLDKFRKNLGIGVLTLAFLANFMLSYKQYQIQNEFEKRMEIYTKK